MEVLRFSGSYEMRQSNFRYCRVHSTKYATVMDAKWVSVAIILMETS